jgi:hypothetical protein
MKFEMARLYSGFAARRTRIDWTFGGARAERSNRIKAMFCDVLRHFHRGTVAKRRHPVAAPLAVAVALLTGCASVGGLSADAPADVKRDAVAARAKARWERLIDRDLAGAYEYMSPASRATMPFDLYKAKHKVGMYRSVKVDDVQCEADTCTVKLRLTYAYKGLKGVKEPITMTTPLTEQWIISQGQAWFVDRG